MGRMFDQGGIISDFRPQVTGFWCVQRICKMDTIVQQACGGGMLAHQTMEAVRL